MGPKIQDAFSRHIRDERAHARRLIITKYHSIIFCVHKINKLINHGMFLITFLLLLFLGKANSNFELAFPCRKSDF